jgi:two-component system CAI-1 autoinducer sensor kinase/phosphatase CqsS
MTFVTGQSTVNTEKSLVAASNIFVLALLQLLRQVRDTIAGGIRHIEGNMVAVCVCAAIMFPAYWFVWTFLFPQPYENLSLRLVGSLFCLIVAAKDRWPNRARAYLPVVWLGTVLYCGPFFFTYMLLQNDTSTVWLLSTMAGLFLVVLLVDWISLFVLFIGGALVAWRVHLLLTPDTMAVGAYFQFVPIFLFALVTGAIFNYRAAGLRQAKERARLELGLFFANEMQAPLFSVRTNTASLKKFLPSLVHSYSANRRPPGMPESMRQHLQALELVPTRIEAAVEQMRGAIEILMSEGGQVSAAHDGTSSMLRCLDAAIARVPLAAEFDRARIIVDRHSDFLVSGSPVLLVHVLQRVLDAACNEVASDSGAELMVSLGQAGRWNYLRLADSASELRGTVARLRSRLSRDDREFSDRPDLALAKLVLERSGGAVTRSLTLGRTDETVLWFAKAGANAAEDARSA